MTLLTSLWLTALILTKAAAPVVAVMLYAAAIASAALMLRGGQP